MLVFIGFPCDLILSIKLSATLEFGGEIKGKKGAKNIEDVLICDI